MAHTGAEYDDPGADYYTAATPTRQETRRDQLQQLGYDVTLCPTAVSA
jgi:hypothetical protein